MIDVILIIIALFIYDIAKFLFNIIVDAFHDSYKEVQEEKRKQSPLYRPSKFAQKLAEAEERAKSKQ